MCSTSPHQRGFVMRSGFKASMPVILLTIILSNFSVSVVNAQTVTEPPVPVYFTYQENGIKTAYKDSLSDQRQALDEATKQIDSLRIQLKKISAENSTRFTWLYTLIALLIITIIALLLLISYIKKELPQTKRVERH